MSLFPLILWLHPMQKMIMHLLQFQNFKILKSMNPYLLQFVILHLQRRLGHGRWKIVMRQKVSYFWLFPHQCYRFVRKHLFASTSFKNLNPIPHLNAGWKKSSLVGVKKKIVQVCQPSRLFVRFVWTLRVSMTSNVCFVKGWLLGDDGSWLESMLPLNEWMSYRDSHICQLNELMNLFLRLMRSFWVKPSFGMNQPSTSYFLTLTLTGWFSCFDYPFWWDSMNDGL